MRLVLVGWGAIGSEVARLLKERAAPVDLVGVAVRDTARDMGVPLIDDPAALATLTPDLVVEAAGRAAVMPWGLASLSAGADFVPASTSAFADEGTLEALLDVARRNRRQVLIPPGALGGIDALAAAAR
ncbi:MAG: aspartate dehydrogenase, partial [Roseovarius sp.]|nr:aspartate dehydrogenase [Roseovarius sp.]